MNLPKLTSKIPEEFIPPYFEPLEYGDPASHFPPLGLIIRDCVDKFGNDVAIIDEQDKEYSFSDIYNKVKNFCYGLIEDGFTKEDKLCICMPDRVEWPISFLGALSLGVVVPADDWVPPETTKYILEHAGIKYVVCLASKVEELTKIGVKGIKFITVDEKVENALFFPDITEQKYDGALDEKLVSIMKAQKPSDMSFILYTS